MKSFELDDENFANLVKIIYNSTDSQANHNVDPFDRFSQNIVKEKLSEMIACNDHESCKILTALFKKK